MTRLDEQARTLHRAVVDLIRRYQAGERSDPCCRGITVAQCHSLHALADRESLSMGELASRLDVTLSTATRLIDQLVAKRLVYRGIDPRDRRVCCVGLTGHGRRVHADIASDTIEIQKRILEEIDPDARERVVEAVVELSRAIDRWRERTRAGVAADCGDTSTADRETGGPEDDAEAEPR